MSALSTRPAGRTNQTPSRSTTVRILAGPEFAFFVSVEFYRALTERTGSFESSHLAAAADTGAGGILILTLAALSRAAYRRKTDSDDIVDEWTSSGRPGRSGETDNKVTAREILNFPGSVPGLQIAWHFLHGAKEVTLTGR